MRQRLLAVMLIAGALAGCPSVRYDPLRASRPYPRDLHTTHTVDIQVFRDSTSIELVNATPRSYENFELWINQRYRRRIDSLPAGATIKVSLWRFFDERGETLNAGGLLATDLPTPVYLVEIQEAEDQPLVGLIAIGD